MGTTLNGFMQNRVPTSNESTEPSKQTAAVTPPHPTTTNNAPPATHENVATDIDIDDFISQYGSFFSIHSATKHSDNVSVISHSNSCSSSDTQYTVSSEKDIPSKTSPYIPPIDIKSPDQLKPKTSETPNTAYSPFSPVTPSTPSLQHRRSSTFQNDNEFKILHGKCKCHVPCCKAIKRIIKILKWHSLTVNNDILIQKVMDSQYDKYLLDDYQHILNDHLYELKAIREEVDKQIGACNAAECATFDRYMELVSKDLSQCDDATFCLNLIDLIHCYIIHFKM